MQYSDLLSIAIDFIAHVLQVIYCVNVCVNFSQLIFTCSNNGSTLYCMQLISQRLFYKSYIVNVCVNFTQLIFICFNNGYTLIY